MKKQIIAILFCMAILLNVSGCLPMTDRELYSGNTAEPLDVCKAYIEVVIEMPEEFTSYVNDMDEFRRHYYEIHIKNGVSEYFNLYYIFSYDNVQDAFLMTCDSMIFTKEPLTAEEIEKFKEQNNWNEPFTGEELEIDAFNLKALYYLEEQIESKTQGYEYLLEEKEIDFAQGKYVEDNGIAELRVFNKGEEGMYVAMLHYYEEEGLEEPIYKEYHFEDKPLREYSDWLCENYIPTWENYIVYP